MFYIKRRYSYDEANSLTTPPGTGSNVLVRINTLILLLKSLLNTTWYNLRIPEVKEQIGEPLPKPKKYAYLGVHLEEVCYGSQE